MKERRDSVGLLIFQSGLLWASLPLLWSYLPVYMESNGYTASQIGILMAINPLIAIVLQPLIGPMVDKSKSKNIFFLYLMGGTVISSLFIPLNNNYYYVLMVITVLSIFQSSLFPISESISLETAERMGRSYAPFRLAGTFSYSAAALMIGWAMKIDPRGLFVVTAFVGLIHMFFVWKIPHVQGHQHKHSNLSAWHIFDDKSLVIYYVFAAVASMLMSFFYIFMPIMFIQIGGSQEALGWVFFIGAMSEMPFLLFADRIVNKFGIKITLVVSMLVVGLRILVLVFASVPAWFYPISAMNGLAFIVFSYTLAVYINRTVKKELKTTGQAFLAISMGVGRVLGSFVGGILIDAIGMNRTFVLSFIVSVSAIILFVASINIFIHGKKVSRA